MSFWKAREILTDVHDRYFPQFYDEETKTFKVQPKAATEETLKKLEGLITTSTKETRGIHEPPHLNNVRYLTTEVRAVHWFHDGFFYGSNNDTLFKSTDGVNWTVVHDFGNNSDIAWVIVSDTNRFIVGFGLGHVYVGKEDGTFSPEPTIITGHLDVRWGQVKYNNVIAFSTYSAPKGILGDGKHEAFLSTDNGATFTKIFDNATPATFSPLKDEDYHLHDIEYDPYTGRIYLWSGDFNNRLLQFSDDWGVTWKATTERGVMQNATQIIATTRGLALGSDTSPGGMGFINIDRSENAMAEPTLENYDNLHWYFSKLTDRFIATRRWVDREKGIYLVGYTPEYSDTNSGFIVYSKDGYTWDIIHKTPEKGSYLGFRTVVYGNGLIVASHQKANDVRETFVAEVNLD